MLAGERLCSKSCRLKENVTSHMRPALSQPKVTVESTIDLYTEVLTIQCGGGYDIGVGVQCTKQQWLTIIG